MVLLRVIQDAAGLPSKDGKELDRLMMEVEGRGEGSLVLVPEDGDVGGAAAEGIATAATSLPGADNAKKDNETKPATAGKQKSEANTIDLDSQPFTVTLSPKLQQKCQSTIVLIYERLR